MREPMVIYWYGGHRGFGRKCLVCAFYSLALLVNLWGCAKREGVPPARLPELMKELGDPDPRVRERAAGVLSNYKEQAWQVVPKLAAALDDPDPGVRERAVGSLGSMGRYAASVKPQIIRMLRDKNNSVRTVAAMSLAEIGGLSEADVNALSALLTDPQGSVRMSPEDPQRGVRISVAEAIGSAGTAGRAALPNLEAALGDRDAGIRGAAAKAIGLVGSDRASSVEGLSRLLTDRDEFASDEAAKALAQLGRPASAAAPALRVALKAKSGRTRVFAALALWRASRDAEAAVPVLVDNLSTQEINSGGAVPVNQPDVYVRRSAAESLTEIADSGARAREIVQKSLKERIAAAPPDVEQGIREILDKIGKGNGGNSGDDIPLGKEKADKPN